MSGLLDGIARAAAAIMGGLDGLAGIFAPHVAILVIPAVAVVVLALVRDYRLGAIINVAASGLTFLAGFSLLFADRVRTDVLLIDDFNIYLVTLTTFVGFTTSIFSASYIGHELEIGRLTPLYLRFYHALYQAMMGAMNVALIANNIGLLWVGVEVATLSTVMMVGIYRTPEAVEAAWKYFILGSVGIALAFFGTILVYLVAQEVMGEGLPAMAWDLMLRRASAFDPRLLSLAFVFLLVGYGTKVGLAPFHAWLPDAHAEGPTPISAVLSGLLLNVALYALLRFKMLLAANRGSIDVGLILVVLGLMSLVFAAFMLYRRRDIKRLFAYSSIEHMGIITFAFGIGGPLANFAGLLHMTMHSLTKSAIFFAVGHIAQVKGTQRIADIRGLSVTHPVLAVGLTLGVVAIAGLPPFGLFLSEFVLVSSSFARAPVVAVVLVVGIIVAFGALVLRMQHVVFGHPSGARTKVQASYVPLFLHLALVFMAGVWLPGPIVSWFRAVAAQLG
jgi:hydrogenase-4 component F